MGFKALRIVSINEKDESDIINDTSHLLGSMKESNDNWVAQVDSKDLNKTLYATNENAKNTLGLSSNGFDIETLGDVKNEIKFNIGISHIYSKNNSELVNYSSIVTPNLLDNLEDKSKVPDINAVVTPIKEKIAQIKEYFEINKDNLISKDDIDDWKRQTRYDTNEKLRRPTIGEIVILRDKRLPALREEITNLNEEMRRTITQKTTEMGTAIEELINEMETEIRGDLESMQQRIMNGINSMRVPAPSGSGSGSGNGNTPTPETPSQEINVQPSWLIPFLDTNKITPLGNLPLTEIPTILGIVGQSDFNALKKIIEQEVKSGKTSGFIPLARIIGAYRSAVIAYLKERPQYTVEIVSQWAPHETSIVKNPLSAGWMWQKP